MRCLERNKQTFYYALYEGKEQIIDSDGHKTGQKRVIYSDPVEMKANISPARGVSDVDMFGITETYTKAIVTDDISCPIKEDSIIWIGKDAYEVKDGQRIVTPHNYVVVRVAPSLNSLVIAVLEVDFNE